SVPARVMVPVVVTGPPLVVSPVVPPETATLVTVPPVPVATSVVPLKDRPLPRVIAEGAAARPVGLARSVVAATFDISARLTVPPDAVMTIPFVTVRLLTTPSVMASPLGY